ncbi:MAG: hypothetical protein Q7U73_18765 [Rubrivivax sp.]|nr:hypothetical protein [Rubrivivax sp.]
MRHPIYTRTQSLWLMWALLLPTLAGVGVSMWAKNGVAAALGLALLLGVGAVLLLVLGTFTVEVGEGRIEWRFGVLGWPRWQVALDEVTGVEVTASTLLEGWGIRHTKSGMLYNAQGLQAVRLRLRDGRTLRLGSDEPERLAGFITSRLQPAQAERTADQPRPRPR